MQLQFAFGLLPNGLMLNIGSVNTFHRITQRTVPHRHVPFWPHSIHAADMSMQFLSTPLPVLTQMLFQCCYPSLPLPEGIWAGRRDIDNGHASRASMDHVGQRARSCTITMTLNIQLFTQVQSNGLCNCTR